MINHQYKLIYLHIPKCGGKSVETYFCGKPEANPHDKSWQLLSEIVQGGYKDYFKFTIIRNPIDRFMSVLNHYLSGGNGSAEEKPYKKIIQKSGPNKIAQNVEQYKNEYIPGFMLDFQYRWTPNLDKLFLIDNISEQMELLGKRFGIQGKFPKINRSKKILKNQHLNQDSIKALESFYAEDLTLYKGLKVETLGHSF